MNTISEQIAESNASLSIAPQILESNRLTAAWRGQSRQLGARLRGGDGAGKPIEHQEPELVKDYHENLKYRCLVCLMSYSMANNGWTYWI